LDRDVVVAAALLHDVGHPPFGHAGEAALDETLKRHGVHEGFDANAQSFRIATRLAQVAAGAPGFNLTRATLDASLKYPFTYDEAPRSKYGVYRDDVPVFRWVRGTKPNHRPSLEASLVDCADEIAYTVQDLVDFARAGIVPLGDVSRDTHAVGARGEAVSRILQRLETTRNAPSMGAVHQALRVLDDLCRSGSHQRGPLTGLHQVRRQLLQRYVHALEVEGVNDAIAVRLAPDLRLELKVLLEFTRAYVFTTYLETQQRQQAQSLTAVFEVYVEACRRPAARQERLPVPVPPEVFEDQPQAQRLRAIADVVSGLTESDVRQLHQQLI